MTERFRLVNKLELKKDNKLIKIRVSTVELSGDDYELPFETMIFQDTDSDIAIADFQERYKTKEEAKKNHYHILDMLQSNFFELIPTEYKIKIRGYE